MAESYPDLIRQLAQARRGLEEDQSEAHHWHRRQLTGAAAAIESAQQAVATAADEVTAARALIARVDNEAALLWRTLGVRLGRRGGRRLGSVPAPGESAGTERDPGALLRRVRARLDQVPARRTRPLWLPAALALFTVVAVGLALFLVMANLG